MLTLFGWFVLTVALIMLSIGVYISSHQLVLIGIMLLITIYITTKTDIHLNVQFQYPKKSYYGRCISINIEISGDNPIHRITIDELKLKKVKKRKKWTIVGEWSPNGMGKIPLPKIKVWYSDIFGISLKNKIHIPKEQILILPKKGFVLSTKKNIFKQQYGAHRSKIIGGTDEFVSLRQYIPGDDIRFIDWKSTARTGEYHVKEMVGYKREKVLIVSDFTEKSYYGGYLGRIVEDSLRLVMSHLSIKDSVGIYIVSDKDTLLPLSSTSSQNEKVVVIFGNHEYGGFFDMLKVAKKISAHYPRGMRIYILTNILEVENLEKGLKHMIAQDHKIKIFTYFEPSFSETKDHPIYLAAEQLFFEKVNEIKKKFRRKGIPIITIKKTVNPQMILQS